MEQELKRQLIMLAEAFTAATGKHRSTVAKMAVNDPGFFLRIERGPGAFNVRTFDHVVSWFSDNWPESCPWPEGIVRPAADTGAPVSEAAQ